MIVDIYTYQQFLYIYKKVEKLVIIFYRDGDIGSKLMLREFNKYSKDPSYRDITFVSIDFDVFDELVDIYDISTPNIAMFMHNKIVERVIKDDELFLIEEFLDEILVKKLKK